MKELEYDSFNYEGENIPIQNALDDDGDLRPLYDRDNLFCPECEEARLKFTRATYFRRAFLSTKQEAIGMTNKHASNCSHAYERASKRVICEHYDNLTSSQIKDKLNAAINRFLRQRQDRRGERRFTNIEDNPAIINTKDRTNCKHLSIPTKSFSRFESIWEDEDALREYLRSLLHKEGFDHSGLIYGMGHAVYSISDPRARVFKGFVQKLSVEKNREKEFELYDRVERLASEVIASERRIYKGVCANVDFYSGFVYRMLGLPEELFTPIFAIARISGWSAHRIEELINSNKIIRPAYKAIIDPRAYISLAER